MTDETPDQPTQYGLVMPFVAVESTGGPYPDAAYVAGYEMGQLDAELATATFTATVRPIRAANAEQADLIAMRHGFRTRTGPETDGWVELRVERP